MPATAVKPPVYRCRCAACGWTGYRRGWFRAFQPPSTPEKRVHVDACPQCGAERVLGLSPRLDQRWR